MATALPILQATTPGTYTPGAAWAPYVTIPSASFTVGHRYLIISYAEIRSYYSGAYYNVVASLQYNGTSPFYQSNNPGRNESTGFIACHTCELYTIPSGSGTGLQLGSYWQNNAGGQIRNMRLLAIDMDVNNTDFPQQSGNGWVYGATETIQNLTTLPLNYASTPQFTPDGESDYLLIASGQVYNINNGQAIIGVGLGGGEFLYNQARMYEGVSTGGSVVMMSACVRRLPKVPTTATVRAVASGTDGRIINAHVLAIRLNTFTKRGGQQAGQTVVAGQSWQSGISITPSPATEAGDAMLVFSCVMGNTWTADTNSMSSQVLRNPGANAIAIGTSFNHRDTTDVLGPVLCFTDTADGANSYQQQFKRNTNNDYPGFANHSVLVAVKAEVGYTPTTKTYLPVLQDRDNGWYKTLTATMTDFAWIPGYSFIAGHRYVVFGYAEVLAPNTGVSNFVLRFNGTTLPTTDQAVVIQQNTIPTVIQCMDFVTGTGSGVGLTFAGRIESGTLADYTLQRFRIVAIDLDVNATDLPQQSANGWVTASNDSAVALTTTCTSHSSLTFTPDGDSDYLVIGAGRIRNMSGGYYGYCGPSSDYYVTGGGAQINVSRFHQAAGTERYTYVSTWVLKKPTNAPTKISWDAWVSGGPSGVIDYSRIFVLRMKTFVKQGAEHAVSPTIVNDMTVQQVASVTMSPATVAGDQLLIFSRVQGYGWTALGYQVGKYIRRDPGALNIDSQRWTNISSANDYFGPTNETLEIATGANNYSLAVQRHSGNFYPTNFYHATLAVISTEVKYVAPTKSYMPMITVWGLSPVAPDSPTWLTQATIGGYRFISGHRYLVIASFAQYVQQVGTYQIRARLVFNGVEMVGCANNDSQIYGVYVPFTILGRVTGTGSGTGLELQGQEIGASAANVLAPVLTAIDLDVDDSKFEQDSIVGWLWAENLVSASTPTYPTFTTHSSLTFTPDGTSDYLVMGDVELLSTSATASVGYARLQRDGSPLSTPNKTDCSTSGTRSHLSFSWLLEAPVAVSTTLDLQTSRSGGAYPTTVASRLIVIRLDCFQKKGKQFLTAGSHQNSTTVYEDIGPVATLSSAPTEVGEKFILVAGWQGQWTSNSRMMFRIYDPVGLVGAYESVNTRYGAGMSDYKNMLISVVGSNNALINPTWRPQDKPGDFGPTFVETQRLMVVLSSEFPLSAFEDAAALGSILLSGAAASYRLLGAAAVGTIEVLGSAQPMRLVNPVASGLIGLTGSAAMERLREMVSSGSIQVLGVAHGFTAEGLPLPTVQRVFLQATGIGVADLMDIGLWGDDDPLVKNRLKVIGSTQLGIDPLFAGSSYVFNGPASASPIRLGFFRGDRIYLFQAQGEAAGPNAGKTLTIFDPATLEIMEALVHPDATPYKFFVAKRGK